MAVTQFHQAMAAAVGALGLLLFGGVAQAQQAHTSDRTLGGRGQASLVRMDAQRAVDAMALPCAVRDAAFLGRDANGRPAWEVACAAGDGHVVLDGAGALDCLALSNGSTPCRLAANRDPARAVAPLAAAAGVSCRVTDGRLVGRTPEEAWVYEIGCEQEPGVWIERLGQAWTVTPCDRVVAKGGECRFTSEAQLDAALVQRVTSVCPARRARWMGSEPAGEWYEAACADGRRLVARIDAAGAVVETLPCEEAGLIGAGCRLRD